VARHRARRKIRFFLYVDPIDELIGRQRGSIWFDNLYQDKRPSKHKSWDYQHHKDTRGIKIEAMEDEFIDAIDKKYHAPHHRSEVIVDMIDEGFNQHEVAAILGISKRTVGRDLVRMRLEILDED
jgi:DNA-directed RNA polymerase specialized sigma24 family protein